MTALAEAIAHLDVRFGARTVTAAAAAADRARQRRFMTRTSFDRIAGGIQTGAAASLTGEGTCGKVTLALRAVAGAQSDGGLALWVDPTRSFDPLAAERAGVDARRTIVVRPRTAGEIVLAAGAGLRSEGFRLVVVDLGPSFASVASPDALAPVLPNVRGSTAALLVLSDHPARRLSLPAFAFERSGWDRVDGRTLGWLVEVRRVDRPGRSVALLRVGGLGRALVDGGVRADVEEVAV